MPILWVFETDVFVVLKGLFAIEKNRKSFIHDLFSRSMTWEYRSYKGLQGVTRSYRVLQWVARGYRGLQGITGGYMGLEGVTGGEMG